MGHRPVWRIAIRDPCGWRRRVDAAMCPYIYKYTHTHTYIHTHIWYIHSARARTQFAHTHTRLSTTETTSVVDSLEHTASGALTKTNLHLRLIPNRKFLLQLLSNIYMEIRCTHGTASRTKINETKRNKIEKYNRTLFILFHSGGFSKTSLEEDLGFNPGFAASRRDQGYRKDFRCGLSLPTFALG